MSPGTQMLLALFIGIVLLILMILKTKVHAFLGLIVAAIVIGLLGGMAPADVPASIISGFGGTLGSIGIIIGFGVMMGQIFDKTGAAERMALTFIKLFGKKREHWAMALTGFIVSIPIFCDSGFVIVNPIAKAISRKTRRSIVAIAGPLAAGLVVTHSLVPPTPGPLGVAGVFNVDVGRFILWGILISLPMVIVATLYCQWLGKRLYQLPADSGEGWVRPAEAEVLAEADVMTPSQPLPSAFESFLPLLCPIVLILFNNVFAALGWAASGFGQAITFLGTPIVAVAIGLLLAIFVLGRKLDRKTVLAEMDAGIKSAGIIILVTGGGGALGQILKDSGTGTYVAELLAQTPIPIIILPFIIATLVRFVQGSGTVAMVTSAGICAPILAAAGANMMLGAFAAYIGSLFFSYFNDSYFWVVNNLMGFTDTKEQIRNWSVTSTVAWAVGFVELMILAIFL
ncbi:MAG: GntP family permease [Clostridia bacterium]|nr:GntP family permease [Clostridia bacterium]